jgi:hypothetical protein
VAALLPLLQLSPASLGEREGVVVSKGRHVLERSIRVPSGVALRGRGAARVGTGRHGSFTGNQVDGYRGEGLKRVP